jgi:hypothetical protein
VLDAAEEVQVSVIIEAAEITGLRRARLVELRRGLIRPRPVADELTPSADADLPFSAAQYRLAGSRVDDLDLNPRQRSARRVQALFERVSGAGEDRRAAGLGRAVAGT